MHLQRDTAPKGLAYFCEKKRGYERGWKAWLIVGLYLLGALFLENILHLAQESGSTHQWKSGALIAYLVFFPVTARWMARRLTHA